MWEKGGGGKDRMGISAKGGRGDEIRSFLRFPLAPAEGRRKSGSEGIGNCEEDHDGRMGEAASSASSE